MCSGQLVLATVRAFLRQSKYLRHTAQGVKGSSSLSAGGKLALATVGGSPTSASEVALLTVDGPEQLLSAQPSQWQILRRSSKVEVCLQAPHMSSLSCRLISDAGQASQAAGQESSKARATKIR